MSGRARVGIFAPVGPFAGGPQRRRATLDHIADSGVDHVCVGDHVSFIWISPQRFASVVQQIAKVATDAGRDPSHFEHAINVWCGFGTTRPAARAPLAAAMQTFYQMPFEPFERYSPYGRPEDVAEFLRDYIDAGCSVLNVISCASDHEIAVDAVGELRQLMASAT